MNKPRRIGKTGVTALLLIGPSVALAHGGSADGLAGGVLHPLGGLDHVLAFLAMGLWAAAAGRGATAGKLGIGLVAVAAGAALALNGIALPLIEYGVLASVLVLGLIVAAGARLTQLGTALIAGFALLHGYAHGSEIPTLASSTLFVAGFIAASAAIQFVGLRFGRALELHPRLMRASGALISFAGVALALAR